VYTCVCVYVMYVCGLCVVYVCLSVCLCTGFYFCHGHIHMYKRIIIYASVQKLMRDDV